MEAALVRSGRAAAARERARVSMNPSACLSPSTREQLLPGEGSPRPPAHLTLGPGPRVITPLGGSTTLCWSFACSHGITSRLGRDLATATTYLSLWEPPLDVRRRERPRQATTTWPDDQPGARRHQRDVHLHLVLADGRHRPLRPGQHGLLHRRHRRVPDRQGRPLVHPGGHALQLRRPQRLHRELRHVRPRRRLPDRQGGHGWRAGPARGLGPALRLHPDRADQRRDGRAVLHRPDQRAAGAGDATAC